MRVNLDGQEYWVPDGLPGSTTYDEMRRLAMPARLRDALDEIERLRSELDACPPLGDDELLAWARENHPGEARRGLLHRQLGEQQAIVDGYSA